MIDQYEFSVDWFSPHWQNWLIVTAGCKISKILEIGSFEGRSTCTMIEHFSKMAPLNFFCIDNWAADFEHGAFDMNAAELRFDRNVLRAAKRAPNLVKIYKYKGTSLTQMNALIHNGHCQSFDLVFVDGSHQACDVLSDLVLSYHLCTIGGLIICDDYLWSQEPHGREDILDMPRTAIDAFIAIYCRKLEQLGNLPLYQVYLRKTA